MNYIVNIFVAGLLFVCAGCSVQRVSWPVHELNVRVPSTSHHTMSVESGISDSRTDGQINIKNISEIDLFCGSLTFRVISDYPTSYLEAGENILVLKNIYLPHGETVNSNLSSLGVSVDDYSASAHIRAIHANNDFDSCRSAKFVDFCQFANKENQEQSVLNSLLEFYNASNCEELELGIKNAKIVDLRNVESFAVRPFIYFDTKQKFLVADTTDAREFERQLTRVTKATYKPVFHHVPQECFEQDSLNIFEKYKKQELCAVPR